LVGTEWVAEVEGSSNYTVVVKLSKKGDIEETYCNCPYDGGEYCKHQAAVFYALRDLPPQEKTQKKQKNIAEKSKKQDLKTILLAQTPETLAAILMEYAENDKRLKSDLLLRFSDAGNVEARARDLIKASVKKATHKGFVEYGSTSQAIEGAEKVMNMAEGMIGADSPVSCAKLFIIVLEEMMDLLGYCDDSNGEVGGVIEGAKQGLADIVTGLSADFSGKHEIFELILNHALSPLYNGWHSWRLEIMAACVPLCGDPVLRGRLETQLEDRQYDRYDKMCAQRIMLNIITGFDGEEKADAYLERNLDNNDFRKTLIEKAISKGQLDRALELCLDGESSDAAWPGLVRRWQELRFSVHERKGDVLPQKILASRFVLDGHFEYYPKLKALYAEADWPDARDKLLADFGGRNNSGVYVKILVAEGLKPGIMEYCRKFPLSLTDLYKHLVPDYKDEIQVLFTELIRSSVARASDRARYHDVCGIIKHFRKACGKTPASEIISELMETYKKRPAFVDELKKC